MKRKKRFVRYFIFVLFYGIFTLVCNVLHGCMEEYGLWISGCWYFGTLFFWIVTALVWILLLKEIVGQTGSGGGKE